MSTKFFTNKEENTLINTFEGLLSNNPMINSFDAVVGYLRASGYFMLRPFLNKMSKIRILIGIDVDKFIVDAHNRGVLFFGDPEGTKEEYLRSLKMDIETSKYSKQVEDGIIQMARDIIDGKVELRAHPSKKIHAKIYILYPEDFNDYTLNAAAITGSSNLSGNGLGLTNERQYEFNVLLHDHDDVAFAKTEFECLWEEAKDCKIITTDIQSVIDTTYIGKDATPYEIYIKMMIEYFDSQINDEVNDPYEIPDGYQRLEYQTDAVEEGYRKMMKYNGFFLADVVGLGKTVIASMIAKKFLIENGRENTKILVIYPPAVELNWKKTFKDFGLERYTSFITNGSLNKILDEENYNYGNADEYDLVLVDEAHKFRNHTSGMFNQLQEICKMPRINQGNITGYKKKIMLISATPMNNSPEDIYHEIILFQDPRRCTIEGATNLTNFFAPLIVGFKKLKQNPDYSLKDYKCLAEKVRERVIKPLTVRRTRTDIESVPRYNKDINDFPKVEKPIVKLYQLNEHQSYLFNNAMISLTKDLTYARYQAIAGLKTKYSEGLYDNAEVVSRSLAYIRKTSLVKRLESSFEAFIISLNKFRQANQNMIDMFNKGKVFIAPDLDINKFIEDGFSEEKIEELLNAKADDNPKNAIFTPDKFKPEFLQQLNTDQQVLERMCNDWESVKQSGDDPKFDKFNDLLKHEFFDKSKNIGQKLVIFSESKDTVNYLERRIRRNDVLVVSAGNRNKEFKTILENFDANYITHKDDYNILITTDVLAEGINLHRSNVIINYDTPWNSTRLMQRIGRVNRIGSISKHIYNYVFYPSDEGDDEIKLKKTSLAKIQTFHSTFGEDNQIYSTEEIIDPNMEKLFIEGLPKEEVNKEVLFFEELHNLYKNNRKEYNRINRFSLRSRTGRESRTINGVMLNEDTLVFLKTNLRKVFYRASNESCDELSILDAFEYFKADVGEQKVPRIEAHHNHVGKAKCKFDHDIHEEAHLADSKSVGITLGRQTATAIKFVNMFIPNIQNVDTRLLFEQLKKIIERGVITYIPKRLERMSRRFSKNLITYDDAIDELMNMAKKYNAYFVSDAESKQVSEESSIIILSESFN